MFRYYLPFILFRHKKQRFFISVVCFLSCAFLAHSKEIQKITTPYFTIKFPKSASYPAQSIANTLETIYSPVSKTLGVYPSHIRLFMNIDSTELNAYFKPIPRHICFGTLYHPDPHFIGNVDWLSMLCLHEFRHVVQHSIEYHSTPTWLRPLYFGGNLVSLFSVSNFFKEGDAVGIETALSKSGRGRLPGWEKLYKVNLLERGPASFSRQLFGSFKYKIPSEYHLGYYFTTHIRRKYGANAIKSIFEKSVRGIPYFGFYNAIQKVTKKSILKVYDEMNQELLSNWQKQLAGLKITPATQLTFKQPNDSFDYIAPFIDASGRLIAWKKGIGLRDQLVEVAIAPFASSKWKKIFSSLSKDKTIFNLVNNNLPSVSFAIGEGCAAWLEMRNHPWQGNKQTIRLQYYDFKQKKRRTLVSRSKYIALAISPNTKQLVAVTTDETGRHLLFILETKSGQVIKKIDNPDNGYYLTPSWVDEDHIIVVKTKNQKNSILRINVASSKTEVLLPYTHEHRNCPIVYKDYLLYNSSYNGIDNIYAMHLPTKACFQVTSRKYGAYLGMVHTPTNQLVFNDYTKNGMDIAVMPFDPSLWTPIEKVEDRSVRYYEPLVLQENNSDILEKVTKHKYPIDQHWFVEDDLAFIGTTITPNWDDRGLHIEPFSLVNLEDTLKVTPYFYQNFNFRSLNNDENINFGYKTSELGLKVNYATCYPILEVDIKANRYREENNKEEEKDFIIGPHIHLDKSYNNHLHKCFTRHLTRGRNYSYWTPELNLTIKLPYYFTLSSSSGKASLKAKVNLRRFSKKIYHTKIYEFNIHNESTKSKRDVYPPWSQSLSVSFYDGKNSIPWLFEPNQVSNSYQNWISFNTTFYFPGVGHHHYLRLAPKINRFKPIDNHPLPIDNHPFWQQQVNVTYGLPLFYPECGIPLIWFLEKVWIEGYYNSKLRKIGKQKNTFDQIFDNEKVVASDAIGTKIWLSSRLLSNTIIPCIKFSIDCPFLRKEHDSWKFEFPLPELEFEFDIFNRKKFVVEQN